MGCCQIQISKNSANFDNTRHSSCNEEHKYYNNKKLPLKISINSRIITVLKPSNNVLRCIKEVSPELEISPLI